MAIDAVPPEHSVQKRCKLAFPTARICILTNHNDTFLREAAQQAGAQKCVLKEDPNQLANVLDELAEQEQK